MHQEQPTKVTPPVQYHPAIEQQRVKSEVVWVVSAVYSSPRFSS